MADRRSSWAFVPHRAMNGQMVSGSESRYVLDVHDRLPARVFFAGRGGRTWKHGIRAPDQLIQ